MNPATWIPTLMSLMFTGFFNNFYEQLTQTILLELGNLMSFAADGLSLPIVRNGILYSQVLATSILLPKAGMEIYKTYILLQEGDPDGDISETLTRTVEAGIVIWTIPIIIAAIFNFGKKMTADVASLNTFDQSNLLGKLATNIALATGWLMPCMACIVVILIIVVYIQTVIRAADLAGMAVIGAVFATNLTNPNHNSWSAWLRKLIILCTAQALQIFFLAGAFTNPFQGAKGLLLSFGWMIACIKSPKGLQEIAYSTGLSGAVGGTTKTAGTMIALRMMMGK